MQIYWLALGIFAVWRITHLLSAEQGPWHLADWLRQRAATGFWGDLLGCFYCCSLWIALPFALILGGGWGERLLLWPALSAGAIVLERLTNRDSGPPPAVYVEGAEREEKQDVLRQRHTTGREHAGEEPAAELRARPPTKGSGASHPGLL